jgi:isocitrate dehydrogenase kinase/phosphatase
MVMLVFDLPSFPYVFKLIKDYYPPQKDTTREQIKGQVPAGQAARPRGPHGRHAGVQRTWPFRACRFEQELIAEIVKFAPSQLEISDRDQRWRSRGHHQTPVHRAAHDPAQHLPARSL